MQENKQLKKIEIDESGFGGDLLPPRAKSGREINALANHPEMDYSDRVANIADFPAIAGRWPTECIDQLEPVFSFLWENRTKLLELLDKESFSDSSIDPSSFRIIEHMCVACLLSYKQQHEWSITEYGKIIQDKLHRLRSNRVDVEELKPFLFEYNLEYALQFQSAEKPFYENGETWNPAYPDMLDKLAESPYGVAHKDLEKTLNAPRSVCLEFLANAISIGLVQGLREKWVLSMRGMSMLD